MEMNYFLIRKEQRKKYRVIIAYLYNFMTKYMVYTYVIQLISQLINLGFL